MNAQRLKQSILIDLIDYGAATATQLCDRFDEPHSRVYSLLRGMEFRGLVERAGLAPRVEGGPVMRGMLWRRSDKGREPFNRCRAVLETTHRGRCKLFRCGYSLGHDGTGSHAFAFHVDPQRRATWKDSDPGASYLGRHDDPHTGDNDGGTPRSREPMPEG
jgi:hypothetical protein